MKKYFLSLNVINNQSASQKLKDNKREKMLKCIFCLLTCLLMQTKQNV